MNARRRRQRVLHRPGGWKQAGARPRPPAGRWLRRGGEARCALASGSKAQRVAAPGRSGGDAPAGARGAARTNEAGQAARHCAPLTPASPPPSPLFNFNRDIANDYKGKDLVVVCVSPSPWTPFSSFPPQPDHARCIATCAAIKPRSRACRAASCMHTERVPKQRPCFAPQETPSP